MTPETLILAAIAVPAIGAMLIPVFRSVPNLRETVTIVTALALFAIVVSLAVAVSGGARPAVNLWQVTPALALSFRIEPLGMLFACVASTLWIVNSVYSIGYMRGHDEPRQTPFYVCFALALSATMGLAFSSNLFTMFVFYEMLTISTYPLVAHARTREAMRGARIYLTMLIGSSLLLFLPAILITYALAGTLDFTAGGILGGKADGMVMGLLLALYAFGIGKAGVMPGHFWLPAAMVAPTPVSALLHAVAVVKAGVFCVLKVVVYVFGIDTLRTSGQSEWLIYVASFTILAASIVAMMQDNLKKRLAYSTVSQLSYIVLAAAIATKMSIVGGGLQIAMHAMGKITLFFCAGAIYVIAHKTEVSELTGLGRKMPYTFAAFLVGAMSIIGLPPLGGSWAKWWIMAGALDAGQLAVVGVLIVSSLLNVAYLLPIPFKALFLPAPKLASAGAAGVEMADGLERKYWMVVLPPCLTAFGCLVLFFTVDWFAALLQPIVSP
ncbi:MAG: proton-conducting transporter membrane subunit [Beijerinckiaceae bacterium]